MKKVFVLLLLITFVFSCSSDDDENTNVPFDAVEYIKSLDGYWVKSRTATIQGMCNNGPVQPTTANWDWFYKFDLNTYFNQIHWIIQPSCSTEGNFIESCKTYFANHTLAKLGEGGYLGRVEGNVIYWDVARGNYKITLSSDRQSLNVIIGEPGGNDRDEGTYILVSKEDADAMLNSESSCPQ